MFDWQEYLVVAEELAARDPIEERHVRAALSRAYYATFNIARQYLIDGRRIPALSRQGIHRVVWKALAESEDPLERQLGNIGGRLKSLRIGVDYSSDYPVTLENFRLMLDQARHFIEEFERLGSRR